MRRTLAVALAAGVLLLGGCDRLHATGSASPPATGQSPAADQPPATAPARTVTHIATTTNPPAAAKTVDSLLNAVDKQLSSDDQPAQDQD
jgi:hypothetical protein